VVEGRQLVRQSRADPATSHDDDVHGPDSTGPPGRLGRRSTVRSWLYSPG
jgi:hypothetical protein